MGTNVSKEEVDNVKAKLNLSPAETRDLLKAFTDLGGSGRIDREKFLELVGRMRTDSSDKTKAWNTVFDMLDLDGNQVIDFYEFSVAMIYHSKLTNEEKIDNIFRMVDFDKDNKVTYGELHKAVDAASRIKLAKRASLTNMKTVFPELASGKKEQLDAAEFKEALGTEKGQELLNLMGLL